MDYKLERPPYGGNERRYYVVVRGEIVGQVNFRGTWGWSANGRGGVSARGHSKDAAARELVKKLFGYE